jgi:hypothetical protein
MLGITQGFPDIGGAVNLGSQGNEEGMVNGQMSILNVKISI